MATEATRGLAQAEAGAVGMQDDIAPKNRRMHLLRRLFFRGCFCGAMS